MTPNPDLSCAIQIGGLLLICVGALVAMTNVAGGVSVAIAGALVCWASFERRQ